MQGSLFCRQSLARYDNNPSPPSQWAATMGCNATARRYHVERGPSKGVNGDVTVVRLPIEVPNYGTEFYPLCDESSTGFCPGWSSPVARDVPTSPKSFYH